MSKSEPEKRAYVSQEEQLKVISVRLSFWHIRRAKKIGNGVLSEGIRIALETVNNKDK